MVEDQTEITLNGPQWDAYQALQPGNTVTIPWGRGVGKSWFERFAMHSLVTQWDGVLRTNALKPFRGVRIVMLMPTLKQFKDVHSQLLLQELADDFAYLRAKPDRTTWRVAFPGGSWIQPFPAAEHNSKASRGLRCDVALIDECDDVDPSVYNSVTVPWFSEPWSLNMKLAGGTPRRGRHGLLYQLHRLGISQKPQHKRYFSFHATWRDAPENVSAEVALEAKESTPLAVYKREWECDFDAAEGLVYDLFDERFHVRLPPEGIRFSKYVAGVDWGYKDPGVILVFGIAGHGKDAQAWLLREFYESDLVIEQWRERADALRLEFPGIKFFCDPSQPASIRSLGPNAVGANNKIDQGISCVADKLFQRGSDDDRWSRLYVHPSAENTIREFGEYRRKKDPRDPDRHLETIEDRNNHAMDALRYALFAEFGMPEVVRTSRIAS